MASQQFEGFSPMGNAILQIFIDFCVGEAVLEVVLEVGNENRVPTERCGGALWMESDSPGCSPLKQCHLFPAWVIIKY